MKPIIFDGRRWQEKEAENLKLKTKSFLEKEGRKPCLVIFLGGDKNSQLFTKMKAKFGRKIGIDVRKVKVKNGEQLRMLLEDANLSDEVDGTMIQLPLPEEVLDKSNRIDKTEEFVDLISREKDVDGMRKNSKFMPAAVRGVKEVFEQEYANLGINELGERVAAVVGATGWVGRGIVQMLSGFRFKKVIEITRHTTATLGDLKEADVVISAVGKPGLITGGMLKNGVVCLDLGVGRGDFDFISAAKKASFITPVPGGLGPATIACLFENLCDIL